LAIILFLRACLTSPRARLGGIFSALTALKILAIRQDCCGFLPCRTKNLSRQSEHAEILNRLLKEKESKRISWRNYRFASDCQKSSPQEFRLSFVFHSCPDHAPGGHGKTEFCQKAFLLILFRAVAAKRTLAAQAARSAASGV
jgi:hypothetical protein